MLFRSVGTPGNPENPTACYFGTLAVGAIATMTVVVNIRSNVIPEGATEITIHNDVEVSSDTYELNMADNYYTEDTTIAEGTVLSIHKQAVNPVAHRGVPINYTLYITNVGPGTALAVRLLDDLIDPKRDLTLVQSNISGSSCTRCGSCQYADFGYANPQVQCELADLPVGYTRRIDLKFDINPRLICDYAFTNTLTLDPLVNPRITISKKKSSR